ncbi:hypothetical protein HK100_007390 [Physocladia obscura]|uniref:Uncharacterized protein n=1 Tax=Physocladia obscura TaxID=109957 RepID=A0AAD5T5C2_9FUNG|nr:hypothetical protein HK100_007390 [Physocladia obscura]
MSMVWCSHIQVTIHETTRILARSPNPDEFSLFLQQNPHLFWSGLWTIHYDKNVIMTPSAREKFILPNKRPLPSYMALRDSEVSISASILTATPVKKTGFSFLSSFLTKTTTGIKTKTSTSLPSPEEIVRMMSKINQTNAELDNFILNTGFETANLRFLNAVNSGTLSKFSHAIFLRFVFLNIITVKQQNRPRSEGTAQILDGIESYFQKCTSLLVATDFESDESIWTRNRGMTYICFWIQIVTASLMAVKSPGALTDFEIFINEGIARELAWEGLWRLYYSERAMQSIEAEVLILPADLKKIPTYLAK